MSHYTVPGIHFPGQRKTMLYLLFAVGLCAFVIARHHSNADARYWYSNYVTVGLSVRHVPVFILPKRLNGFPVSGLTCWNALPSELKLAASTLDHFCSRLKTVLFIRSYYACMSAAVHNCVISPAWYINAVTLTLTLTIPAQLAGVQVMKCTQNLSLYSSYSPDLCCCPTFNIQNCMPLTVILLLSSVKVLIGEIWRVASSDSLTPKQSKRCLRIIFLQLSYSEALDKSGLNRLDTRREEITKQIFRQSPTHPLYYLISPPKVSSS